MKTIQDYVKEDIFDLDKSILIGEIVDDQGTTISDFKNGVMQISSKNVIQLDESTIHTYLKLRDQHNVKKFVFNNNLNIIPNKNFDNCKGLVLDIDNHGCIIYMKQHGPAHLKNVDLIGKEPHGFITIENTQSLWDHIYLENVNMNCAALFLDNTSFPYNKNCKFNFSTPYIFLRGEQYKLGLERCLKEDSQVDFDYLFDTYRIPNNIKKKYIFVIDNWIIHKSNKAYKEYRGKISGEWKIV